MDQRHLDDMNLADVRRELTGLMNKIPPAFQAWGVMQAREFKDAISRARTRLDGGKEPLIRESLKVVRGYWA